MQASMRGKSRRDVLRSFRAPYDEPPEPLPAARYLVDLFYHSGMYLPGAAGPVPMTWLELEAFDRQFCAEMNQWEMQMVMKLSRWYVGGLHEYRSPDAAAPYQSEATREANEQRRKDMAEWRKRQNAMHARRRPQR